MSDHEPGPATLAPRRLPTTLNLLVAAHLLAAIVLGILVAAGFDDVLAGNGRALTQVAVFAAGAALSSCSVFGLLTLQRWAWQLQLVLAAAGLLAFPVGTVVSSSLLVVLTRRRVRLLFRGDRTGARASLGQTDASPRQRVAWRVLAFVMFVGVLAVAQIPTFTHIAQQGKQRRSVVALRSIAEALGDYHRDHGIYPKADTIDALRRALEGDYLDDMPEVDAWGHSLVIRSSPTGYELRSPGHDGRLDTAPPRGASGSFDADIILESGRLTQWPASLEIESSS